MCKFCAKISFPKLFLAAVIVISLGLILGVIKSLKELPKITPTAAPTIENETADWKTYRNEKYGFEVKYPSALLQSSFVKNTATFFSIPLSCEDQFGRMVQVNDFKITFKPRSGSNYNQIWKDTFEFDFNKDSYDGSEIIGGKTAYYLSIGAEMEIPVTTYIIEQTPNTALEISIYYLEHGMVTNCTPPLESAKNKLNGLGSQILSTFRFID